jgi:hypothetical protein
VRAADVALDGNLEAVRVRREMENEARQTVQFPTAERGAAAGD